MGKKQNIDDPGKTAEFRANPFAALNAKALAIPEEPKPPAKPATPPPPVAGAELSAADRELLKAFGNSKLNVGHQASGTDRQVTGPVKGFVRLQVQRKGKGGKTVTRVFGLTELDLAAQMELAKRLQQGLGTGAHFDEGILELHGDLRERAAEWFRKNGYRAG